MAFTVTATATEQSGTTGLLLRVKVLTGAKPASQQNGGTAGAASASSVAFDQAVTVAATGSWIYGAAANFTAATAFTADTQTTLIDNVANSSGGDQWGTFRSTATTSTTGSQTFGCSAPTGNAGAVALAEILAGTGLAESASAPAAVSSTSANNVTTASFNPPAGSLLVALAAADGGSPTVTSVTITDSSGLGLTWTALKTAAVANADYAGVFIAQMPAASSPAQLTSYQGGQVYRRRQAQQRQQLISSPAVITATPVTEADAAAGLDDGGLGVSAAAPLADPAAAVDAPVINADVPVADVAGSVDALVVQASIPVADTAGAAEAAAVALAQADAAGAADTLAVQVTVPVADTGAAADAAGVAAAVPVADAAGSADTLAVAVAVPLADPAAAADTATAAVTLGLADTAAAIESQVSGVPITTADTAGAADTLAVTVTGPQAETAGAADALTVTVTLGLAEQAGAADSWIAGIASIEADAAGAADMLAVSVSGPDAETAAGADALAAAVTLPLQDTAGAAEALAVAGGIPAAEAAAGADQLAVAVSVALSETAGAAETEGTGKQIPVSLADTAAGADYILVISASLKTGTVWWYARPEHGRWRPEPFPARWDATPAAGRWSAHPAEARWKATPAPARWTAVLQNFDPVSAASTEMINIRWTSDLDGTVVDPTVTPLPVQAGFAPSSGNPLAPAMPSTWYTGSWLAGGTGKGFVSQHPAGAGTTGPVLTAGQKYDVWGYIQGTPESPKKFAGVLTVY